MRARTCTIFAWVYGEDVDAICSMLIVPTKNFWQKQEGKHNNFEWTKDLGGWVTVFTEAKAGYFIKQYQDLLDLQKVNFMDKPAIFTHLLHNCDIRSRTTIGKQFSSRVLNTRKCQRRIWVVWRIAERTRDRHRKSSLLCHKASLKKRIKSTLK